MPAGAKGCRSDSGPSEVHANICDFCAFGAAPVYTDEREGFSHKRTQSCFPFIERREAPIPSSLSAPGIVPLDAAVVLMSCSSSSLESPTHAHASILLVLSQGNDGGCFPPHSFQCSRAKERPGAFYEMCPFQEREN